MNVSTVWKKYSFAWVTLILFLASLTGHWLLAWRAYVNESEQHGNKPEAAEYLVEVGRDTLENWQSEFLQLIWQVAGLAFLFYLGSPQSREGDERKEEKLDALLREVNAKRGEEIIAKLDKKYPRG
jgi:hypothetical protein